MRIKDFRIGTQMKIGFGMILILILSLGAIAWQQTDKLAQHTMDMYDHPFTVRQALGRFKADVLTMQLEYRNALLTKNEKDIKAALVNSKIFETDAGQQLQVLSERYLGPKIDVIEARKAFARWVEVRDENVDLIKEGRIAEAIDRLQDNGEIGTEREQLLKWINNIDVFSSNKAAEFLSNTTVLKNTLHQQLGLLLVIALTLTIIIVYFLNKNIHSPISELSSVSQQFKDGDLTVRSSYQSRNEFGLLSSSFNKLADTIQTELLLNDQVANLAGVMLSEDDAHNFCHALVSSLLDYTGAQMGAVYLLNEEKSSFNQFESVGLDTHGNHSFSAAHYEGEFGKALATRQIQHIVEIAEDTPFQFLTVSGKFKPREIITIPIVSGNETVAVISLATIKNFNENHLRLLQMILSTLSARIDSILAYKKVIAFSKQLEQQNNELEVQKRELFMQTNELTEQNIELEMQKKQLGEANRMKTSFLSNMSHELRTPLNSVIALSGVLNRRLKGNVPEEEYSYLEVIERNGKQLLLLINDILDLSRIESGHEEVDIKKIKIDELIESVIEMIKPQANQKGIYLRYIAKDNVANISSDYDKCYHILQNLLSNALKFTESGGVEITREARGKTIAITVNDTGIGIEEEHLPYIFDEFRQADSSNSRKYGGTGLGLTIAKKYANLLGGSIKVESTPGKGSSFTLIMPLEARVGETSPEKKTTTTRTPALGHQQNREQAKNKTILLVEDTEAIIIQMKDMLSAQGYNILVAHNGEQALEQIAREVPDAMILDLMMPGVDGFEVLKRVHGEEKTEHLPVIILTAKYVTKEELAFLKNSGVRQLIQKGDINKDQLLEAVNAMMAPERKELEIPVKKEPHRSSHEIPRVMVVEDNPDNMLTIKALLEGKCKITEAYDGLMVPHLALEHQPDLILMDIALPGRNGIETLAELRKEEALRHIPVIAVSASAMKGDREDFIAQGFDEYISKPIDSTIFETTVNKYLI